mmetsp:Transcript_11929/g.25548  ORF Transcript_11929/g.25548 Transcript_11929/m.25548 type:complete len:140 (+) Transcript_11929:642-1061(+)
MWLSASAFFSQYFRVYSPVAFPKKTDPTGNYVRHWIPKLAKLPDKYIYEPWKAPMDVQRAAGCIVGKDYPWPIVDHAVASQENIAKMALVYKEAKEKTNDVTNPGAKRKAMLGENSGDSTKRVRAVGKEKAQRKNPFVP